jgi:hypothetical protein
MAISPVRIGTLPAYKLFIYFSTGNVYHGFPVPVLGLNKRRSKENLNKNMRNEKQNMIDFF